MRTRSELDSVVLGIELTLCSIIQGVALYFLVDNARMLLAAGHANFWPYIAAGLLILLLFWSRSLIHTLTLIRWPIEFVHNFFYIACALVEAIAFTHLTDPFGWFQFTALFALLVWALFVYDLRIVKLRERDSAGVVGCRLYALVERDQRLNIRVIIPVIFCFSVSCAFAVRRWPDLLIVHRGHLILVSLQVVGLIAYLAQVIFSYRQLVPLIAATREEWSNDSFDPPA